MLTARISSQFIQSAWSSEPSWVLFLVWLCLRAVSFCFTIFTLEKKQATSGPAEVGQSRFYLKFLPDILRKETQSQASVAEKLWTALLTTWMGSTSTSVFFYLEPDTQNSETQTPTRYCRHQRSKRWKRAKKFRNGRDREKPGVLFWPKMQWYSRFSTDRFPLPVRCRFWTESIPSASAIPAVWSPSLPTRRVDFSFKVRCGSARAEARNKKCSCHHCGFSLRCKRLLFLVEWETSDCLDSQR